MNSSQANSEIATEERDNVENCLLSKGRINSDDMLRDFGITNLEMHIGSLSHEYSIATRSKMLRDASTGACRRITEYWLSECGVFTTVE